MLFITNQIPNFTGTGSIGMTPADPRVVMEALNSGFISLINDQMTCDVVSNLLGVPVKQRSVSVSPKLGEDTVILVNIIGTTLPAGTKTLPNTHNIQFSVIETKKPAINMKEIKRGIANWLTKA
jgi:hypothetical protein